MRILTLEQFLKEPVGTVYTGYRPDIVDGDIYIKMDWLKEGDCNHWWEMPLIAWWKHEHYEPKIGGDENPTEHACTRESNYHYDKDSLFAVFTKLEIKTMALALHQALNDLEDKE